MSCISKSSFCVFAEMRSCLERDKRSRICSVAAWELAICLCDWVATVYSVLFSDSFLSAEFRATRSLHIATYKKFFISIGINSIGINSIGGTYSELCVIYRFDVLNPLARISYHCVCRSEFGSNRECLQPFRDSESCFFSCGI